MGQNYAYFSRLFLVVFAILGLFSPENTSAQTYTDGPIQLQGRLRQFNLTFAETDVAFFGVVGQPDDLTYYVWLRDAADLDNVSNPSWGPGSGCLTEDYILPLTDWNLTLFNYTYPNNTVPQYLEMRLDAWEDESPDQLLGIGCQGTRCAFETGFCCGGVIFGSCVGAIDDDDLHCDGQPYAQLDYRLGPPCQWYNHGPVSGACTIPANSVYNPRMETYWRYTLGDACANAIPLGTLNQGFTPISHFNSNECYTDNIAYVGGGQDVVYEIQINQPVGLVINTCGLGTANTDVLVMNSSCTMIYNNSGGCGSGSQVSTPLCAPGTYYIVVEGRNASLGTFTLSISEDPALVVAADAGPNVSICLGLGVQIGAQLPGLPAVGGQPGYTYNWTPNTFITSTTDSITTVYPPATTQYILEVQDALGCIDRDTVTVTVNPGPVVNIGPDQTVCPGIPVLFDAGPGFSSYFWNTGSFTQTITTNTAGQYIAVATDLNGCIGRDTALVLNHPQPIVNLGVDTSICIGANLTLDAGPGFNPYVWSNAASTQTISVSAAGNYHVTVTDANGCNGVDTIFIGVDTLPLPVLPPNVQVCPGDNAVLNPGAGWPTYNWSSGSINQIVITPVTGAYTVTVTDGNGCDGTASTNVTNFNAPSPFAITAPSNFLCQGSSMTLTANVGPSVTSYNWSTGASTQTINITQAGDYFLTVTTLNGCDYVDTINIGSQPIPMVELGPDTLICQGTGVQINGPLGANLNYSWSVGGSQPSVTVSTPQTVYLTVTNGLTGCFAIDSIGVSVSPLPVPNVLASQPLCNGDSVLLDPGPGFTSYTWSTTSTNQSIFVSQTGTYTVTVTNAAGCTATSSINLSVLPPISVGLSGPTQSCEGSPISIAADPGFASYSWSNGASGQSISVTATGTYTVTATDVNGCPTSNSQSVVFNPLPVVNLGGRDTLCDGASIVLDAGPGFTTYSWSNGGSSQTTTVSATGLYTVTVTDGNNCQNTATTEVVSSGILPVDIGPGMVMMCDSGSVLLDAGPDYIAYTWTGGTSSNQYLVVDAPGVYSVQVTDQYGCTSTDMVTVIADGIMALDFLADTVIICAGEDLILDAGDQWLYYVWDGGIEDQYLVVDSSGNYGVIVTDPAGCRFTDQITVVVDVPPTLELGPNVNICPDEVLPLNPGAGFVSYLWTTGETSQSIQISAPGVYAVTATYNTCVLEDDILIGDDCPGEIFVPNVFSPNEDGLNDYFEITYVNLDRLSIRIYDRWGKFHFESLNKNFKWDGKTKGKPLPEGVYYYHIKYKLNTSENEEEVKGTVTILR